MPTVFSLLTSVIHASISALSGPTVTGKSMHRMCERGIWKPRTSSLRASMFRAVGSASWFGIAAFLHAVCEPGFIPAVHSIQEALVARLDAEPHCVFLLPGLDTEYPPFPSQNAI